jgi:tetratricopeptide (TPR) repeat protein
MDLDSFRQMVTKNPKGFLGRYGLGNKILQEGGSLEEAVEHLRVAVQLDPLHVASHLALGRALVGLQRPNEAKPVPRSGAGDGSFTAFPRLTGDDMDLETAKQRIDSAITQYGQHAAPAIDLVMNEVRSDLGAKAFNELVEAFDLELLYNIAPLESDHSSS